MGPDHSGFCKSRYAAPSCRKASSSLSRHHSGLPMALPGYCSRRRSASVVKISSRTSCKFCFLFLHLTDTVGGDANPDEHLELRAFPFSLSWRIYAHVFALHQVAKGHLPDACLFAYLTKSAATDKLRRSKGAGKLYRHYPARRSRPRRSALGTIAAAGIFGEKKRPGRGLKPACRRSMGRFVVTT